MEYENYKEKEISVVIPTLNAGKCLPRLLEELKQQDRTPTEIIVVDTESGDGTVNEALSRGCSVRVIQKADFRHGRARNIGAKNASGNVLVFLTQDALPMDECFLRNLTVPIQEGWAVASTARQVPFPDANPIESYSREFNYPDQSHLRTKEDIGEMGIKAIFFSNTASAIDKDIFFKMGGFSENLIVNEDMEFCIRLLKFGYSVAYQAEACIYHSHQYDLFQLSGRYFDIGVFFNQSKQLLRGLSPHPEGKHYLIETLTVLNNRKKKSWIPRFVIETSIKYISFWLGTREEMLPVWVKRRLSGQGYYWQ